MSADLTIVIATYNEVQNLPELVERIREVAPESGILVVDDNSPDGTGKWVREQALQDDRLELIHRQEKAGLGSATVTGIATAMTGHPNWIATMDADLSHRPEDFQAMWKAAAVDQYDVIIGSRYTEGGRIENWSWRRRVASRAVNFFARWILWLGSRDNSSAFRIYRTETLEKIDLDRINCRGYVYLEQILLYLDRCGARIHEVPIVFNERERGESKVTMVELLRNLRDVGLLAIRRS